jgi:hypothetical protein
MQLKQSGALGGFETALKKNEPNPPHGRVTDSMLRHFEVQIRSEMALALAIVVEDLFPAVAPAHDMVHGARNFNS